MRNISNTNGSISESSTSGESGDFTASFAGEDSYKDLINRANSVPLDYIFKLYGITIYGNSHKIICPFKSHKGGSENSASFNWYPNTNSYCCFGCRIGSRPCDFVAEMDGISRLKSANKILDLFKSNVNINNLIIRENYSERLEIMLDFSNCVRDFRQSNLDIASNIFIENICKVYDTVSLKYEDMANDKLKILILKFKEKIGAYPQCHTL